MVTPCYITPCNCKWVLIFFNSHLDLKVTSDDDKKWPSNLKRSWYSPGKFLQGGEWKHTYPHVSICGLCYGLPWFPAKKEALDLGGISGISSHWNQFLSLWSALATWKEHLCDCVCQNSRPWKQMAMFSCRVLLKSTIYNYLHCIYYLQRNFRPPNFDTHLPGHPIGNNMAAPLSTLPGCLQGHSLRKVGCFPCMVYLSYM